MSAKSEAVDAAAELAAKAVAKKALHLINWGKKIIPATADEIARLGPNATRVRALINMVGDLSDNAIKTAGNARQYTRPLMLEAEQSLLANVPKYRSISNPAFSDAADRAGRLINQQDAISAQHAAGIAASAEAVGDLITPQTYRTLTNPIAAARRFDMTVPNAPEGFTNIARSFGERGLISAPKDIELARRVSMLPPAMQQVYFNLLGEGTDPAQLIQALRLMGQ